MLLTLTFWPISRGALSCCLYIHEVLFPRCCLVKPQTVARRKVAAFIDTDGSLCLAKEKGLPSCLITMVNVKRPTNTTLSTVLPTSLPRPRRSSASTRAPRPVRPGSLYSSCSCSARPPRSCAWHRRTEAAAADPGRWALGPPRTGGSSEVPHFRRLPTEDRGGGLATESGQKLNRLELKTSGEALGESKSLGLGGTELFDPSHDGSPTSSGSY